MSAELDFALLGSTYWDDPPVTPRRIAEALAKTHRVLYVEPPASYLHLRMRHRNAAWVRWLRRPRRAAENIFLWTPPPSLPWKTRWRWSNEATQRLHLSSYLHAFAHVGFTKPVVLTFLPHHYRLAARLPQTLLGYYCIDEWTALSRFVHPPTIRSYEEQLARRADFVLATAHSLAARLSAWNRNVAVVPNGVDTAHFARALDTATPAPPEIAGLPEPVIGFSGVCDFRLDVDLLSAVARLRPSWTFLFLGPVAAPIGPLRNLGNVHFLGHRPPEQLPVYFRAFAAAIIPYALNEMTRHIYPVKWNEYLAAGLPVVATPLPELERLSSTLPAPRESLLQLAGTAEEFVAALERALHPSQRSAPAVALRRALAARNTWDARAEVIKQVVGSALATQQIGSRQEEVEAEAAHARSAAISR